MKRGEALEAKKRSCLDQEDRAGKLMGWELVLLLSAQVSQRERFAWRGALEIVESKLRRASQSASSAICSPNDG